MHDPMFFHLDVSAPRTLRATPARTRRRYVRGRWRALVFLLLLLVMAEEARAGSTPPAPQWRQSLLS